MLWSIEEGPVRSAITCNEEFQLVEQRVDQVSEEMIELGSAGLFSLKYPEHPYSQGVREIAAQILSAV